MRYRMSAPESLPDGLTRVEVEFLDNANQVVLVEDFISNVRPTGSRVVTDAQGRMQTTSGSWVTPEQVEARIEAITTWDGKSRQPPPMYEFAREEFTVDVAAVLTEHVESYLHHARDDGTTNAERLAAGSLRGDRTDKRLAAKRLAQREPWLEAVADEVRSVERAIPVDGRRQR